MVRLREQARWYRVLDPTILVTTEKSKKNLKNIIDIFSHMYYYINIITVIIIDLGIRRMKQ